jgi:hypothetical protein
MIRLTIRSGGSPLESQTDHQEEFNTLGDALLFLSKTIPLPVDNFAAVLDMGTKRYFFKKEHYDKTDPSRWISIELEKV